MEENQNQNQTQKQTYLQFLKSRPATLAWLVGAIAVFITIGAVAFCNVEAVKESPVWANVLGGIVVFGGLVASILQPYIEYKDGQK